MAHDFRDKLLCAFLRPTPPVVPPRFLDKFQEIDNRLFNPRLLLLSLFLFLFSDTSVHGVSSLSLS